MLNYLVYASGPLRGKTIRDATGWMTVLQERLHDSVKILSPMRGKLGLFAPNEVLQGVYDNDHPLLTPMALKERDRHDVQRCDAMVVNALGMTIASVGTAIELGWADALRKPVVLMIDRDADNPFRHPLVEAIGAFRVDNIDAAAEMLHAILLPGLL